MNGILSKSLKATLFGVGLTLSPFTLWNDSFVNFPLAFLLSEPIIFMFGTDRVLTYIISYAFTNILGIALMAGTSMPSLAYFSKTLLARIRQQRSI